MIEYDELSKAWIKKVYAQETPEARRFWLYKISHGLMLLGEVSEDGERRSDIERKIIESFAISSEEEARLPEHLDYDRAYQEILEPLEARVNHEKTKKNGGKLLLLKVKIASPKIEPVYRSNVIPFRTRKE